MDPLALTPEALCEPWRLWTGHLIHFGWSHALTNLIAFALPVFLVRRQDRPRIALSLLMIAPLLSLLIMQSIEGGHYRGASGLVCALWACAGLHLAKHDARPLLGFLLLGALGVKLVLELVTGKGAITPGPGWRPLPVAHLWGALLGLAAGASLNFPHSRQAKVAAGL